MLNEFNIIENISFLFFIHLGFTCIVEILSLTFNRTDTMFRLYLYTNIIKIILHKNRLININTGHVVTIWLVSIYKQKHFKTQNIVTARYFTDNPIYV